MHRKYQKGALSLFWAAVFVGVVALAAMVALMSARHERNYFSEALGRFTKTDAGQMIQQTSQAVEKAAKPEATAVRKCTVNGKVVYTNVECDVANPTSRKVEMHDTAGFEAPKIPAPAASQVDSPPTMEERAIEKATR
ncbi:MAG TPA: hypothetical protein VJ698_21780 [Noviherbaspirillum sp.]|uniref:hypothetical protein n=1 Tax=Noviherbaspirillum sp. TaxID=1926288 RepID=UPI002B45DF43|nr:hypothetical protein [Noviherbaspirillum sp.]HJV88115.1 hypothetical protein [Noviherbaspirillum sp.]